MLRILLEKIEWKDKIAGKAWMWMMTMMMMKDRRVRYYKWHDMGAWRLGMRWDSYVVEEAFGYGDV